MSLRLAFMGTPDFAVPSLAHLVDFGHEIAVVYTQPARPKGRGLASGLSAVARLAAQRHLPVRAPQTLKSGSEQAFFSGLRLDAAVVVAYGLLLPKPILDAPRLGCFNLHASILPRWRGAAPIQRAIMAGDSETGVSVMRMEEGLDTGPVLSEERVTIGRKTYGTLHDELARLGAGLLVRTLAALERGLAKAHAQNNVGATYARKIDSAETHVDWTKSAHELDCLIRGLSPQPGAWCLSGNERLKLLDCQLVTAKGRPGEVLDERLSVACGNGALRITRLQRPGRGPMTAEALLRGYPIRAGTQLT